MPKNPKKNKSRLYVTVISNVFEEKNHFSVEIFARGDKLDELQKNEILPPITIFFRGSLQIPSNLPITNDRFDRKIPPHIDYVLSVICKN